MVTDNELIQRVKQQCCDESLKTLIKRHSALYINIVQKYGGYFSNDRERVQDLINEKDHLIYKAALSYEEGKGATFVTWLGNHARYECLNALNSKSRAYIPMDDVELHYHVNQQQVESVDENEVEFIFSVLGRLKDKRIKEVFSLRYFGNRSPSWSGIAKKLKISTQTAINLHEKGRKVLKQKLKSEECFDEL